MHERGLFLYSKGR